MTPRVSRTKRTPSAEEVGLVVAKMTDWPRDLVLVLWGTGCRIGELGNLRVSAIDFRLGEVVVVGKTGRREIPIDASTLAVLRSRCDGKAPDDLVWPVAWTTIRVKLVSKHLPEACAAAKVARFTPHGLRRAAVDRLARAGVGVAEAAQLLGHSQAVMLRSYRQVTKADLRNAVKLARLGALPGTVIEGPWAAAAGEPEPS